MNMKHLPLLAVILAVLIGIIIVANQLNNRRPSEKSLAWIPQFSETDCGMIVVKDLKDSVFIVHKDKDWIVSNRRPSTSAAPSFLSPDSSGKARKISEYPADSAFVQMAIDKLKAMKREDLISQNRQKQMELEVDTIQGTRIDVYNEKMVDIGTFYIGKSGADWTSNFVRAAGSDDVYLIGGSLKYSFFTDRARWKNKVITKFDRSFVKGIEIAKRDSASILLALSAPSAKDTAGRPVWKITSPVKDSARNSEVDKILNTLANFAAADFEEDTAISIDSLGFRKPYLQVTLSFENGDRKTVNIGNEKGSEGKRWVRSSDKPATFLIYKYNIENIDRSLNALRGIPEKKPEPAPKITPAGTKSDKKKQAPKKAAAKAAK
jgi:Domain of unknown function (DUF4340)